jgi:hypothetical protein
MVSHRGFAFAFLSSISFPFDVFFYPPGQALPLTLVRVVQPCQHPSNEENKSWVAWEMVILYSPLLNTPLTPVILTIATVSSPFTFSCCAKPEKLKAMENKSRNDFKQGKLGDFIKEFLQSYPG